MSTIFAIALPSPRGPFDLTLIELTLGRVHFAHPIRPTSDGKLA
jgi:hypothetical protein